MVSSKQKNTKKIVIFIMVSSKQKNWKNRDRYNGVYQTEKY